MAVATFKGSSGSRAAGYRAVFTAQKRHPRVQVSPITMNVAVPPSQHSPMFGQRASSQTVASLSCRARCWIAWYRGEPGMRTLSHGGLFVRVTRQDILVDPGAHGDERRAG